ncbi:MAG: hypothetical protein ACJAYC_000389 [Halieaceae bacterium]|jgi:hypothetical protein
MRVFAALGLLIISPVLWADQHRATVQVEAGLSYDQSWELLQDFSLAHNYVPGLSSTEIMSVAQRGLGAHRRVYDEDGDYLEETITSWREGQGFTLDLHEGEEPMAPFEQIEFIYTVAPGAGNKTQIQLELAFIMPWGWLGDTLAEWVILPIMEDTLVQIAAGMKYFYETGVPATDEDRKNGAAAVQVIIAAAGAD